MEVTTMNATTILCIFLLSLYLLLAVFWIVRSIIDTIDDRKREKRNAAWEAERQQLEKERALREVEYHEARMRALDKS
jgi:F0F1-type ATP synthase membrane subunit b/b'